MQRDEALYERVFAEVFLYFYRNRSQFDNWKIVVIYPSRKTEQRNIQPYQELLDISQVHRIYLDELGDIRELPLWVALMRLTTVDAAQAPEEARYILDRTQKTTPSATSRAIIDMVITIIAYKFEQLSRKDVETMLGIAIKKTRVYREIKEEGLEEGRLAAASMVLGLLQKRFGSVANSTQATIKALPLSTLKSLCIAVLDFSSLDELDLWLNSYQNS